MKTLETNTTRDRCIICGKKLTGRHYKYCSMNCAQIGYKKGKAVRQSDDSKSVEKLYERFKKAFRVQRTFHDKNGGQKARVFISLCLALGYSVTSIGKGIGKDHSTVTRHKQKITQEDERIAQEFYNNKNYVDGSKYNNFTYGEKK